VRLMTWRAISAWPNMQDTHGAEAPDLVCELREAAVAAELNDADE